VTAFAAWAKLLAVRTVLIATTLILSAAGCASSGGGGSVPQAVALEFHGKAGEVTETRYYSNAHIQSFQDGQLLRDRFEGVDFVVASRVTEVLPTSHILKFDVQTTSKDGTVELHDLAFPELGEKIDYVIRGDGEVLRAGNFAPESLFYVPALPIPKAPVEIGDTWTMEHTWISSRDGIPLTLQVVGILKNIVKCEKSGVCADLEINGHVKLAAQPTNPGVRFNSRIWGRVLFSLQRGDVIWSDMRSAEDMGLKSDKMAVRSCMVSEMKLEGDAKIQFACDPNDDHVTATPRY
jgi:hypothetical protein